MKLYDFAKANANKYVMLWLYVRDFIETRDSDYFAFISGYLRCLRDVGDISIEQFEKLDSELDNGFLHGFNIER